jgi:2-C-methyl-D-erythritol 4-phosphate cytidylyltransferase
MVRTHEENIRQMDDQKNVEEAIILQKEEGMTTYKMAGQCDDRGHRLERKSGGQSRLEKVHQGL